ncbi:Ig-like domain-containing protein [Pontibacter arcticus]|uniref:PKD domain-containing protein n=1 Tax=Pontibacter arcticus TaxID=2080288 RepID=A0A364RH02_9BACT|nr:gliding motility-associated C-terminal domain-containing protein [Pontibacter arcticus]RAU83547.1 hypothetical protein DP923_00235 [Pontibacter arcticus]
MNILLPLLYSLLLITPEKTTLPKAQKAIETTAPTQIWNPELAKIVYQPTGITQQITATAVATTSSSADCKANATLTDITSGSPFMNCSSIGSTFSLTVKNSSTTTATNTGYRIDWGDGSPIETFANHFTTTNHVYTTRGTFNLKFSAFDVSGCETTSTYQVFNISNPGFTVGNPGSTTACLTPESPSVTFNFPIYDIEGNPNSTIYTFTIDDGRPAVTYTHTQLIATRDPLTKEIKIPITFTKSSCQNPSQSFTLGSSAVYTCGGAARRTGGTIQGIIINKSTNADFTIGGGPLYCAGGDITMGDATQNPELCPISFNWSILDGVQDTDWRFVTGGPTSSQVKIKFIKAGKYRVRLKTFTDGCGSDEVIKEVTIVEAAKADFILDPTESSGCKNLLVTPENTSTGYQITYNWTLRKGSANAVAGTDYVLKNSTKLTDKEPQFEFLREGTYTLALQAKNGCSSTSTSKPILVKGLPSVTLSQAVASNCGPFTIDYTGQHTANWNAGTTKKYNWTVNNGATFTGGTSATVANPKISFPAEGEYTVTLTIENECGVSNTATQKVTVNDFPAAPQVIGQTLCINDVAMLSVVSPIPNYTYRWYGSASGGNPLYTGTTFPTPPLQGNTTYYAEAVSDKGCASQTRTAVEVKALSAVTGNDIKAHQTICEGETPAEIEGGTPSGGGGAPYTFLWEISTNGTDFTAAPLDANGSNDQKNYTPTGSFTKDTWFQRKVFNTPCQTVISNAVKITVVPTPKQPVVTNPGICFGQSTTLTVENAEANVTYYWFDAPAGGNLIFTGEVFKTDPLEAAETYYVVAVSKIKASCFLATRTEVKVNVTPPLVGGTNLTTSTQSVCYGTAPADAITGNAPTGGNGSYTYKWFASTQDAFTGFNEIIGATAKDYKPGNLTKRTWYKRIAYSGDCSIESGVVDINVEALPLAPSITGTTTVCYGSTTTLTAIAPGGTYRWYDKDDKLVSSDNVFTTTALEATTTYTVEAISATGCTGPRTTVTVTVTPPIQNNKITGDQTVCKGSSVSSLGGTLPKGGGEAKPRFLWEYRTENGSFEAAPGDNSKQTYLPTGTFTEDTWFRRTVFSDPCQQHFSNEIKITVIPLPQAPVVADASACYGTTVTLTVNAPVEGIKYKWYEDATGNSLLQIDNTYKTPILKADVTYYVEAVSDNGSECTSTSRTPVKVTVTPALNGGDVISTPKPIVCAGDTPGMIDGDEPSGGNGNYTYQWYATTKTNPAPEDFEKITGATNKAYTPVSLTETTRFKRVVYSESCSKESIVIRVVAEPLPAAPTITGNLNICSGSTTFLSATAPGGTYRWYDATGTLIRTASNFTTPVLDATTTYQVETESATGCVGPRTTVTVKVTPVITNTITPEKTAICAGDDAGTIGGTISGGTGTFDLIYWEQSINGEPYRRITAADGQASYSPGNLTNTTTFRRTVKSDDCVNRSNEVTILIANSIAGNTITGAKTVCEGSNPGTLSGNGEDGFEYQWFSKTAGQTEFTEVEGTEGQKKDLTPGAITETTLFRRIIKSGNCSSISNTIQVTVQPKIANNSILATGQEIICYNTAPAMFEGSKAVNGTGYVWQWAQASNPNVWSAAPGVNNTESYTLKQNLTQGYLFRRVVLADKCEQSISNIITISVAQAIVNRITTATTTYCVGTVPAPFRSSQPLVATGNIRWERSLNGGPEQVVARTEDYTPTEALGAGTWTFRRIVNSGCADVVSNLITIQINPAITGNSIRKPDPACVNATITLEPNDGLKGGNSTYTYQWQQSFDGVTFTNINKATNTYANDPYLVVPVNKHTWFRRVVTSGGCSDISAAVELLQPIKYNRILTADQVLCSNTTVGEIRGTMPSDGNGKYEYIWEASTQGPNIGFKAADGNNTGQHYTPAQPLKETTWFRRIVKSAPCQQLMSENVLKVEIRPVPPVPVAADVTICRGSIATLTATAAAGTTILWYEQATGGTQVGVGPSVKTRALTADKIYYVEAKDQFNCSSSERREVKITVVTPVANAGEDVNVEQGKAVTLSASGGVKYSWSPAAGLSDATLANPLAMPKQTTTYTVTITTAEGCTATDQVVVTVLPKVDPANVITLNNDNVNDKFIIKNIESYPNCRVEIFTRWGEKVFESVGYKDAWDGTKNGKPLPMAAYYYVIYLNDGEAPISGSVTILK